MRFPPIPIVRRVISSELAGRPELAGLAATEVGLVVREAVAHTVDVCRIRVRLDMQELHAAACRLAHLQQVVDELQ